MEALCVLCGVGSWAVVAALGGGVSGGVVVFVGGVNGGVSGGVSGGFGGVSVVCWWSC